MDNQHKLVKGYRDLSQSEIDAMNSIKLAEQDIGQLWQQVKVMPGVDQRCLALAKTGLQESFSWFVRAVARPLDVFELVLEPEEDTFLSRLKAERDDLLVRMEKLSAFIGSEAFDQLDPEASSDLLVQKDAMNNLAFILSKRYDDLVGK